MNTDQITLKEKNTAMANYSGNSSSRERSPHLIKRIAKRTFDILISLIFFIVLGWLFFAVWIAVLITTGSPAIYRHQRTGKNGRKFNCLKFRSMVVNSAEVLEVHLKENPEARAEWERDFKLRKDPRITKFGKFIRRTSLDELPQFWNVLRGDMSIVGPRPVVARELELYYGEHAKDYQRVKPGITGPWQIGGRNDLSYAERIKLDVSYAANWSVAGDLLIVWRTVFVVLARRGSY